MVSPDSTQSRKGPDDFDSWIDWKNYRNTCCVCGTHKHAVVKNYDMMWGDADLWCKKCDVKIRGMDFG